MGRALHLHLIAAFLALWSAFIAAPAMAAERDEPSFAPSCVAYSDLSRSFTAMAERSVWTCDPKSWRADTDVVWLRFEDEVWAGEERPRYLFTRIARFKTMKIAALDADGTMRELSFPESAGKPFAAGPVFEVPLPEVKAETRAVLVRVEKPHSIPLLTEARLTFHSEDADWSQLEMMVLALVIGMLILPLLFDLSFFFVLRERFVVLHAVMVTSMISYVLFSGGLISAFVTLPLALIAIAGPLSWAIGCGVSALFLADFLEKGIQSPAMRRMLQATGLWTIALPGLFALQLHALHPYDDRGYFVTFIPAIVMISLSLALAVRKGSRAAGFIAIGWFPIIAVSIERMLRGLGVYAGPSSLDQGLYLATVAEVVMMSLALADRLMALKRERDAALADARALERLSEHDPLTGLMNRRAVEARFDKLYAAGFHTFALVDLDLFKQINDRFGHQAGDAALVACGEAIRGGEERNEIAVRMGGEEFVVLLRGRQTLQRAEALRQAIPLRIATRVPGLDRPVTASMGVIELPKTGGNAMGFNQLYARADALMYQAKQGGRNRMCYEKLTVFREAPPTRRAAPAEDNSAQDAA